MEDPQRRIRDDDSNETDDERRQREQREQEEALERLLLAQEEAEDSHHHPRHQQRDDQGAAAANDGANENNGMIVGQPDHNHNFAAEGDHDHDHGHDHNDGDDDDQHIHDHIDDGNNQNGQYITRKISYVQASFGAALGLLFYALRTRQQWYLAIIYLASSKFTYIVWGNALVAACMSVFFGFCNFFLKGLRMPEAEGLGDFFRWNVTETCLALTMFRSSLNVTTGCLFVGLICLKCLHWVVSQRESHLRMTEEAIYAFPDNNNTHNWPMIRSSFLRLFCAFITLQFIDIWTITQCTQIILSDNGPTVYILFAFENAILLVSIISNILLWNLHVMDGLIHYFHDQHPNYVGNNVLHPWKDYRATFIFIIEIQVQTCKFIFYIAFFVIIWTYNNTIPINLIREVYMNFVYLKQKLKAFHKYRKLMSSMKSFACPSEDDLSGGNNVCIICRDEMTVTTSKILPGCQHIFHKSCLREWLVQQQTCPTCRSDIPTMTARRRVFELEGGGDNDNDGNGNGDGEQQEGNNDEQENGNEAATEEGTNNDDDDDDEPTLTVQEAAMEQAQRMRDAALQMAEKEQKHVRFATTEIFPAFYKVTNGFGANVWNDEANIVERNNIPYGTIVMATEIQYKNGEMMVKMPDGWMKESDLERIVSVFLAD